VLAYNNYVQAKPKAIWLTLTNCVLDLPESCYKTYYGGKPTELFIPVRNEQHPADHQIHVVLATSDPAQLKTFSELQALDSKKEALEWIAKNSKRALCPKDITGLVRFGIKLNEKERRRLSSLVENAAGDFVILEEGSRPSLSAGLGYSLAGVMMLGAVVAYFRRNREPTAAEAY
jgi:hypothetical protein